jgi:hypothetical protein
MSGATGRKQRIEHGVIERGLPVPPYEEWYSPTPDEDEADPRPHGVSFWEAMCIAGGVASNEFGLGGN